MVPADAAARELRPARDGEESEERQSLSWSLTGYPATPHEYSKQLYYLVGVAGFEPAASSSRSNPGRVITRNRARCGLLWLGRRCPRCPPGLSRSWSRSKLAVTLRCARPTRGGSGVARGP